MVAAEARDEPREGDRSQQERQREQRDLAEDRTSWSRRRTLLSKERTFSGWLRTALSAIAVGFAGARLLDDLEPQWLVLFASTALIALGIGALGIGYWSYRSTLREMEDGDIRGLAPAIAGGMVAVLGLVAIAAVALVHLNGR